MECLRGHTLWNASEAVYYRMPQRSYYMEIGMIQRSYTVECPRGHTVWNASEVILYEIPHKSYCMDCLIGHTVWNALEVILYGCLRGHKCKSTTTRSGSHLTS